MPWPSISCSSAPARREGQQRGVPQCAVDEHAHVAAQPARVYPAVIFALHRPGDVERILFAPFTSVRPVAIAAAYGEPPGVGARAVDDSVSPRMRRAQEFLRECKKQGCTVLLLTIEYAEGSRLATRGDRRVLLFVHRARTTRKGAPPPRPAPARSDRIVALDDFDVETGGDRSASTFASRHGRDHGALLPRQAGDAGARAHAGGSCVPDFVHAVNQAMRFCRLATSRAAPPWVLKPRSQAASDQASAELGRAATTLARRRRGALGDRRSSRLRARAVRARATSFHVDSLVGSGTRDRFHAATSTARRRSAWRTRAASSPRAVGKADRRGAAA